MKKQLTMKDIAEMSNVTKSTVSRYFNGGYVKEDTKKRIQAVIEKYNYEPNTFAQSLKAKYSKIIGVVAPCLDSTVSSRVMMTIDDELRKSNYTTIIMNTNHDQKLELKSIENLSRLKVDGIILMATEITEEHKKLAKSLSIPLLFVAQNYKDGVSIINDDYHAGYDIGRYVGKANHHNIVFLGVSEKDEAVGLIRKQGIRDGLKSCGVEQISEFITDFDYEHAALTVDRILEVDRPSIFICATDKIALGAYRSILKAGLKVPDDISLIGFGGYEIASLITPKLVSVRFDSEKAGKIAASTIIDMIYKKEIDKQVIIDYQFMNGDSVKDLN